jgi:hypothetical protein
MGVKIQRCVKTKEKMAKLRVLGQEKRSGTSPCINATGIVFVILQGEKNGRSGKIARFAYFGPCIFFKT